MTGWWDDTQHMALGRITTQATAVRTQPLYICQAGDLWACRKVEVQKKKRSIFLFLESVRTASYNSQIKIILSILNCALVQNPQFIHRLKQISFSSSSFKTTFFWLTAAHKQKVWISGGWGFRVHTTSCVPEMLSMMSYKTESRRKLRMRFYRVSSTVNTLTSLF